TPLTGKEWGYCETDLDIVDAWVQEQIDYYGSVFEIPYTNTGIVRRELKEHIATRGEEVTEAQRRKNIFAWNDANARHWKMTPNDYEALRLAFMGGYTHGTYRHFNRVIEMVTSYDFTSSYPAVMLMEKFPMGTPVKVDPKKFSIPRIYNELDNPQKNEYAYIVMAQFHGLRIRSDVADAPLSKSKAYIKLENGDWVKPKNDNQNMEIFNGRIISADTIATVATEQDLLIFRDAYEWDSVETIWVRRMIKNYLPIELFEVILDLYYKKNTLKGVVGKEQEYMRSKGMLNSVYGMCVTRKDKDTVSYFGDWDIEKGDTAEALAEAMEKYNKSIHTVHNFQSLF
ncbi:DNA polymerase, partial [Herbiconiux daphne]